MYAMTHAVTTLLIKKRYPSASLWALLVSVQAIELLWVVFVYAGIERPEYTADTVHLNFLPYSHSIASAALVALLAWAWLRIGRGQRLLATAVAIGVVSHVVLDIIHHEPDIALLPMAAGPRLGLGLALHPAIDFLVEVLYCVGCWLVFRGSLGLLVAIVVFNVWNLPLMFPRPGTGMLLAQHPAVLPTVILAQILVTWWAVAHFSRVRGR